MRFAHLDALSRSLTRIHLDFDPAKPNESAKSNERTRETLADEAIVVSFSARSRPSCQPTEFQFFRLHFSFIFI